VCDTPEPELDPFDLARSGWIERGDVSLCPDCRTAGWQFPEGAPAPFRRLSDQQ
jgi:hypothetical protein